MIPSLTLETRAPDSEGIYRQEWSSHLILFKRGSDALPGQRLSYGEHGFTSDNIHAHRTQDPSTVGELQNNVPHDIQHLQLSHWLKVSKFQQWDKLPPSYEYSCNDDTSGNTSHHSPARTQQRPAKHNITRTTRQLAESESPGDWPRRGDSPDKPPKPPDTRPLGRIQQDHLRTPPNPSSPRTCKHNQSHCKNPRVHKKLHGLTPRGPHYSNWDEGTRPPDHQHAEQRRTRAAPAA